MSKTNELICFSVPLAVELNCAYLAMLVQFFVNVISHHKRLGRNQRDGFTWNYCTRAELAAHFPFLTARQVRRHLEKLVKLGILRVGNYNKMPGDNTNWYAFQDEVKWGISQPQAIEPEQKPEEGGSDQTVRGSDQTVRGSDQTVRAIPQTKHRPNHDINKVNEGSGEIARPPEVVGAASPSVTSSISRKGSLFKGKVKFSEEQEASFDWLKSLGLDTSEDTLSWWARTYSLTRLDSVYREAVKRNPTSLGAYMQKLLKQEAVVVTGRIEINAEFAKIFKSIQNWHNFEIHQKYGVVSHGNKEIEIDFNMDSEEFGRYLRQKYETFEGRDAFIAPE